MVGRVAAGAPILAVEHIEDRCRVDLRLFRPRADYLLHVKGDSASAYLIRLPPENPDFDPIELDLRNDTLVIQGLGVGVRRTRL